MGRERRWPEKEESARSKLKKPEGAKGRGGDEREMKRRMKRTVVRVWTRVSRTLAHARAATRVTYERARART